MLRAALVAHAAKHPRTLNRKLTSHSMINGNACFASFNKIWGIPVTRITVVFSSQGHMRFVFVFCLAVMLLGRLVSEGADRKQSSDPLDCRGEAPTKRGAIRFWDVPQVGAHYHRCPSDRR
jgi:hypothetical protein